MSLFRRKEKAKKLPSETTVTLGGETHRIKLLMEWEEDSPVAEEKFADMVAYFEKHGEEVEAALAQYVRDHYEQILEFFYLCLRYPSKKSREYQDFLLLKEDYDNKRMEHADIVIRNICPVYYSVTGPNSSYLFLYFNDADGHGFDLHILPEMKGELHG